MSALLVEIFPAIVIAFALAAAALLLILLSFVLKQSRAKKWSANDINEGVSDLLVYDALIEDGVMLNKNGSLSAGWRYRGADVQAMGGQDRNILGVRLNAALKQLGTGWMIHCDTIRSQCAKYSDRNFSHFPDAVSRALDDERRDYFERGDTMYEGENYLVVTWFPPKKIKQGISSIVLTDDSDNAKKESTAERLLREFQRQLESIEGGLQTADGFKLTRLWSEKIETKDHITAIPQPDGTMKPNYGKTEVVYDRLLQWFQRCLTGDNYPIRLPDVPVALHSLVGGQEMFVGLTPNIDGKFIQTVAIDNFPMASSANILDALSLMNIDYRWSTRFIFLDKEDALAQMKKILKKWQQKIRGFFDALMNNTNGRINQDALDMVGGADAAITEQHANNVASGYYTSVIVLRNADLSRLEEDAAYVKKVCGELGFPARVETVNNVEAFLGSLPGHGVENVRRPLLNTVNLAHLLPTSSVWLGADKCPHKKYPENSPALLYGVASGSSPFRLNLHVSDLGHTVIFGPTGAGKSVLLATLAAQFLRYKGMTVFHFDKGRSVYALCKAVNGQHYDIGSSVELLEGGGTESKAHYAFCPLQYLETAKDLDWATQYLSMLCELGGMKVSVKHGNAINALLARWQRSGDKFVSMEDFHTQITSIDSEIAEHLQPYTNAGAYGFIMAAKKDELNFHSTGGYCVFEIDDLLAMGDERITLPVLWYLFRRIFRNLAGQPAIIILDEAWVMLGHEVFRKEIKMWFKELRKKNCAVILATQSLSDAANSGILDVIIESTATKIFLPNPRSHNEEAAALYHKFGLNDQQIKIIADALPKRQYYYTSAMGNRLFELALGQLQLALCAVSDLDDITTIQKLIAQYGEHDWLPQWLRIRHVAENKITEIIRAKEAV
ncbi:conjugal transfer protein TrbE [Planctomycetales bacterium]|nr:conjugal transfer protein TrbE [Planctomycetales bacterium]GHS99032.1 conjugal transfer protein TrbE [Planctomycetales bacterium]GHT03708.1 conjugal transfer protein TrbE [Planctomycetales bacterium]